MAEVTSKSIEVYVCPEPGCTNYYGTVDMPDLSQVWGGPKVEDRAALKAATGSQYTHNRAECPDCRLRPPDYKRIQRVRLRLTLDVPTTGPPTPGKPDQTEPAPEAASRFPDA